MRRAVSLFVAIACTMSHATAFQTRSGGAAAATIESTRKEAIALANDIMQEAPINAIRTRPLARELGAMGLL